MEGSSLPIISTINNFRGTFVLESVVVGRRNKIDGGGSQGANVTSVERLRQNHIACVMFSGL